MSVCNLNCVILCVVSSDRRASERELLLEVVHRLGSNPIIIPEEPPIHPASFHNEHPTTTPPPTTVCMGESSSIVILPDANKAANKEESVEDYGDDEPLEEDSDSHSEKRKKMNGMKKSDELPEHSSSGSGSGSGGSRCMWCREVKVAFKRIAQGNRIVCSACYHKNTMLLC